MISAGHFVEEKVGQMRHYRAVLLAVLVGWSGGVGSGRADTAYDVIRSENGLRLRAGIFERIIEIEGTNVSTSRLSVAGEELLSGPANEVSFTIHFARPDAEPKGIKPGTVAAAVQAQDDAAADVTDILIVKKEDGYEVKQAVEWIDPITVTGRHWDVVFDTLTHNVTCPEPGTTRLNIRARAARSGKLRGLSVDLYYELYAGHPVIRKWIEIRNNSSHWIKVDRLLIDDIELMPAYRNRTDFTPARRGVTASVAALGKKDGSVGVIAVNEIPSAPRIICDNGSMGYVHDYFEWVLGPSERFTSEPVFFYAYAGSSTPTCSGVSTARDRVVESTYRDFLERHILLPVDHHDLPAPVWCSWANFHGQFNQQHLYEQADIAAEIGLVGFQIDAGWGKPGNWSCTATEPNPEKFPDLDAACQYVRDKGLCLGSWISCFRVPDAKDFTALPDAASQPPVHRGNGFGMSFASNWRHYFADDVVYLHDRYGITYLKQDLSNICYGDLAQGHDSRTRKESLLRGLRGFLEAQRDIHDRAPDLVTLVSHEIMWETSGPPCDVASLESAVSYHTSPNDYGGAGNRFSPVNDSWADNPNCNPEKMSRELLETAYDCRRMMFWHRGLPLYRVEYLGATMTHYRGSLTPQIVDRQVCSFLMGLPNVYQGQLSSLTPELIARYKTRFATIKRLQQQYGIYGHFQFSGVPEPTEQDWHWWGKLNAQGCGAVVVLRGTQGDAQRSINIPWVQPDEQYHVTALFSQAELGIFTGKQLQDGALKLALGRLDQEILELALTK